MSVECLYGAGRRRHLTSFPEIEEQLKHSGRVSHLLKSEIWKSTILFSGFEWFSWFSLDFHFFSIELSAEKTQLRSAIIERQRALAVHVHRKIGRSQRVGARNQSEMNFFFRSNFLFSLFIKLKDEYSRFLFRNYLNFHFQNDIFLFFFLLEFASRHPSHRVNNALPARLNFSESFINSFIYVKRK